MNLLLIYIGSISTGLWGIAHLFATRGVIEGFGDLTADNRRIITMEWVAEGVALISTATFVATVTAIQPGGLASQAVYAVAIVTLLAFSAVSLFTGFKISFLPFKLCPFIFSASAGLIFWGAWL